MKKIIALTIVAICALCAPEPKPLHELTSYIQDGTYVVYAEGYVTSPYARRIDNGGHTVLVAKTSAASHVFEGAGNVLGESVSFSGGQAELDGLIRALGMVAVWESEFEGCYYGWSAHLPEGVMISGRKVNCQIVVQDGEITVGWPLIMGSYHLDT